MSYWTNNPIADADMYYRDQLAKQPKRRNCDCSVCGEQIVTAKCWNPKEDAFVCTSCVNKNIKKMRDAGVEDIFIDELNWLIGEYMVETPEVEEYPDEIFTSAYWEEELQKEREAVSA